jgi:hypothetical protein
VERSEEIRRVIERWMRAISTGDDETALRRLSDEPGTLLIGTDAAEWWRGGGSQMLWARQLAEFGALPVTVTEIDAWEEGSVGWAGVKELLSWQGSGSTPVTP